ncbi:hypothetical protein PALB_18870 [Pseudoalteromonas luteoviolacea B = ATCC 29581]|nr:hypothetical protein PALB_18870 [Pseudoalteromonas luteoviolacea B = ATCC 29581]
MEKPLRYSISFFHFQRTPVSQFSAQVYAKIFKSQSPLEQILFYH